jgi:hypothetical protein
MILDDGTLEIFELQECAAQGRKPKKILRPSFEPCFYGELNVGYKRQYAAMGVSQLIDKLVRIWQNRGIAIGMVAVLDDGQQYRIDLAQHLIDENGEPVTHLTLRRLGGLYDVER